MQTTKTTIDLLTQALERVFGYVPQMSGNAERQARIILKSLANAKPLSTRPSRLLERILFTQRNASVLSDSQVRDYAVPAVMIIRLPRADWYPTDTVTTEVPEDAQLKPRMLSSLISLNGKHFFTENAMGEMFSTSRQNINSHLRYLMSEGEVTSSQITVVEKVSNNRKYRVKAFDKHAAYAVALRVRSETAKQFRKALIQLGITFEEQGIVVDQKRVAAGDAELHKKIEQLSEYMVQRNNAKLLKQKISEFFENATDWETLNPEQKGILQARTWNYLYFATHGLSAQEIIQAHFDASSVNCGLQYVPADVSKLQMYHVTNALNYFTERKMKRLNRQASTIKNLIDDRVEDEEEKGLAAKDIMEIIESCASFTSQRKFKKSYTTKKSTTQLIRLSQNWSGNKNRQVSRAALLS